MIVNYIFSISELLTLEKILNIELPIKHISIKDDCIDGLLEKDFVRINNGKVIVNQTIAFILRQLSKFEKEKKEENFKKYICEKVIIDVIQQGDVIKLHVSEKERFGNDG